MAPSIFNDVLGPVMRGPSSSHTAASWRIGAMARSLAGPDWRAASIIFDAHGSFGQTFREQGSDRAFICGLLGIPLTDERFFEAVSLAEAAGRPVTFGLGRIPKDDHPNAVRLEFGMPDGSVFRVRARSTGGGAFTVTEADGWPVALTGRAHEVLVEVPAEKAADLAAWLEALGPAAEAGITEADGKALVRRGLRRPPEPDLPETLKRRFGGRVMMAGAFFHVEQNTPLAGCAADLARLGSLGEAGLVYESGLLGISREAAIAEMEKLAAVMEASVAAGLSGPEHLRPMQILTPTAHRVMAAARAGTLAAGGPHARAAARALAVMHVNGGMGVVSAAPTGGSAGVLPAVMATLPEIMPLDTAGACRALFAAGAVGLALMMRPGGTFAAEVAGCQVEIGLAGAMAAAAVVEAAGGTADQALDAAAVALQNTMGSVCDLVRGAVEVPCHTRNAAAAAAAFTCADLILGGYENPIPLDDTLEASLEVGMALGADYRCTCRGGLAVTPAARRLGQRR